jgi:SsrA-binding protein
MGKRVQAGSDRVLASNRHAFHSYFVGERYEAGIVLLGTEVKSVRRGAANLKEAYVRVDGREVFLFNLLLHRREIVKLGIKARTGGQTLIPLRMYLSKGRIKVEIALAKGKKLWDKREAIKKKDQAREARAAVRG